MIFPVSGRRLSRHGKQPGFRSGKRRHFS